MNSKKLRAVSIAALVLCWVLLCAAAWFLPEKELSEAERRPLASAPALNGNSLLSGKFMTEFEKYALDQFPLRDGFRTVKSLFHQYVLGQKDNNGIYLSEGFAAKQEYPLNPDSVAHALDRFNRVYETYLEPSGSKVYMAIVPDKGFYLAEESGHLAMDYEQMFRLFREGMPWAQHIDLTQSLSLEDYYRTDTHWRQEKILDAAVILSEALEVTPPRVEDYRITALERPFYGVYYGQAALPMEPETMYLMESDLLHDCKVYDFESGKENPVYDLARLESRDLYDVYLSGARSLLTIENPRAPSDRELIVFRDSFGSAMVPFLVQDYAKITLVDIRYIQSGMLNRYISFQGQDVLFLYSTLVLNNSSTIK